SAGPERSARTTGARLSAGGSGGSAAVFRRPHVGRGRFRPGHLGKDRRSPVGLCPRLAVASAECRVTPLSVCTTIPKILGALFPWIGHCSSGTKWERSHDQC